MADYICLMRFLRIILFLTALWMRFDGCSSACVTWVSVPPANYSQNYVEPSSASANSVRPLGFMSDTINFGSADKPCVVVQNAAGNGRHYELNVDGGAGTICAEKSGQTQCFTDGGTKCATVTGDSMTFNFDCQSCEGGSVNFWYRLVLEDAGETGGYDENWCQTREAEFPRSLKSGGRAPVIPTPPDNKNPGGGAVGVNPGRLSTAILAALAGGFLLTCHG